MTKRFLPTRNAALERLSAFAPKAGRDYATRRNYDLPAQGHPNVSQLSPYLRHRLITEQEVIHTILGRYSPATAEKFIQEVCWRTYWKGWLEMRPSVWSDYRRALEKLEVAPGIARAEAGDTDIAAFNAWAQELVETGYLHNHARMWFASIWIFTLKLPWQAGADFFMRHLLDGDAASNTLSWRWVAGLQTQGKHYLARSSNISKYTEGLHNPEWRLNTQAEPLSGPPPPDRRDLPRQIEVDHGLRTGVLLHEEDLSPGIIADCGVEIVSQAALLATNGRSPSEVSSAVTHFAAGAVDDTRTRWRARFGDMGPTSEEIAPLVDWALEARLEQVLTPYATVGPTASALRSLRTALDAHGIRLVRVQRPWDAAAWPHATHGFFRFKKVIPDLLAGI